MTFSHMLKSTGLAVLLGWAPQAIAAPFSYDSYSVLNNQTVRVVDAALIVLDAVGGVEVGALQAWNYADEAGTPARRRSSGGRTGAIAGVIGAPPGLAGRCGSA